MAKDVHSPAVSRAQSLHEARLAAVRINTDTRRKTAVIYAIDAAGRAFLVPDGI